MRKQNELVIFEKFRIKPSQKEKMEIDALKMEFRETPIKTTVAMLFLAVATPFAGEGSKFYKETTSQLVTIFKSSIRDAAISDVGQSIRKKNKKAYQYNEEELKKLILKQESRIKKKGRRGIMRKLVAVLGLGYLPFL